MSIFKVNLIYVFLLYRAGVPEHFLVKVLTPIALINDDFFRASSLVLPELLILLQSPYL